jgi:cell division protein ZapA
MNTERIGTPIEILGKTYQIKCPTEEISSLQHAARYLEEKMRAIQDAGSTIHVDRVAIITALNVVHQLLTLEQQKNQHMQTINQRLQDLQNKVESALSQNRQLELEPAK